MQPFRRALLAALAATSSSAFLAPSALAADHSKIGPVFTQITQGEVSMKWDARPGVLEYRVFRRPAGSQQKWSRLVRTDATKFFDFDEALKAQSTWLYEVRGLLPIGSCPDDVATTAREDQTWCWTDRAFSSPAWIPKLGQEWKLGQGILDAFWNEAGQTDPEMTTDGSQGELPPGDQETQAPAADAPTSDTQPSDPPASDRPTPNTPTHDDTPAPAPGDTPTPTGGAPTAPAPAGRPPLPPVTDPATTSGVLWTADAEHPLDQEWGGMDTITNCGDTTTPGVSDPHVTTVPGIQGRLAWQLHVGDGERCFGNSSERAEIANGNPVRHGFENRLFHEGEERWIALQIRLEPGFPINDTAWNCILQIKQLGTGGPPIGLEAKRGSLILGGVNSTDPNSVNGSEVGSWPMRVGVWVPLALHVVFNRDPSIGSVELYGNPDGHGYRQLQAPTHRTTIKGNGKPIASHLRIGTYRDDTHRGEEAVSYDGITVANNRQAAESNAFRR
jgi:hypothetical protein